MKAPNLSVTVIALASITVAAYAASISVPENLAAPAGQSQALEVNATGVQIYLCSPSKADAGRYEWAFKAPEAQLFDATGKPVGKHYAGPTWEAPDGSKVVGEVKARSDGPDANAIPWLLLAAKSNSGSGVFGQTQSIQRLATVGGKAPASGCAAADAGKELRVDYKAVYRFFNAKP
jgi:hypothetical protein